MANVKSKYLNPFYNPKNGRKQWYHNDPKAKKYKGFQIHKISDAEYHIVKNNECITMMAGINGAKNFIDSENTSK